MKIKLSNKAFLAVLLAAAIGGGMSVFVKVAVSSFPPFVVTFLRFLITTLIVLPLAIRNRNKFNKDFFYKVVPLSLLSTANVTLFAFGVRTTSATISQLLYTVVPVIVAILSYFLLKEKIGARKLVGVILGLFGVVIVILSPLSGGKLALSGSLVGNLMIFLGVFSFSVYSVLSKEFQKRYSPLLLTTGFAFTTTLATLPFAYSEYIYNPVWIQNLGTPAIFSIVYVGIIGAVYYFLHQYAIKQGSPTIASTILFLQPAATYSWAFIILSERLTPGLVIGAILSITGAWLVTRSKK